MSLSPRRSRQAVRAGPTRARRFAHDSRRRRRWTKRRIRATWKRPAAGCGRDGAPREIRGRDGAPSETRGRADGAPERALRYGKIGEPHPAWRLTLNILALDTSTEYCSAALRLGDTTFERGELAGQTHSQLVLAMVDALLRESGVVLGDLHGIA